MCYYIFGWYPGKRAQSLLFSLLFTLDSVLIFQVWILSHSALFFFRTILWYSGCVCIFNTWWISWLYHALLLWQPVIVCQGMSSLGKTKFCANGHVQLCQLCDVIQGDKLNVNDFPANFSLCLNFLFPAQHKLLRLSKVNQGQVPLWFHLPDVLITTGAIPTNHWPFIFRILGFPYLVVSPNLLLCAGFILSCRNSRLLCLCCINKMVDLYLDNSTAKVYLCNQDSTVSLFLSRLACHTLNLPKKHGITPIPAYRHAHLNVESDYLSWGRLVP